MSDDWNSSQPYLWLMTPTFNHLLRPWLDRFVRSFVVKTAQGNNRPAAEVVAVSPYPISGPSPLPLFIAPRIA